MAGGSSEARAVVGVGGAVPLLTKAPPPYERPVDRRIMNRAAWALRDERLGDAATLLGVLLAPFAELPTTLRSTGPVPVGPAPPPDFYQRTGPWDLIRDVHDPRLGDAAIVACRVLQRLNAFPELLAWIDQLRRHNLVWPDETLLDISHAAILIREGRLHGGRLMMEDLLREHPQLPAPRRSHLLHNLGITLSQLGEYRRARDLLAEAVAVCRRASEHWYLGLSLMGHGLVEIHGGRLGDGEALLDEAVTLLDANRQIQYADIARFNLAIALYKQGRLAEALVLVDRVEAALLRAGGSQPWLQTRLVRCKVHLMGGRPEAARRVARAVEKRCAAQNFIREEGLALEIQGDAALLTDDLDTARTYYERAMVMACREAPDGDLAVGLRRRLARVDLLAGNLVAARRGLHEALLACRSAGEQYEEVVSGRLLAEAELALDDATAAKASAHRAVSVARVHGCDLALGRALAVEARAEAELAARGSDAGRRETAWSLAAEARRVFLRLGFDADRTACDEFLSELRESWRTAWIWAGGPPPPESLSGGAEPAFVAGSPAMVSCAETMAAAAASDDPVLITGETGTGKEVATRRIHDLGRRRKGPLVAVNCAAVPADLFEREFFGHAPGAFTGAEGGGSGFVEQAHLGTLFLDEVGELPLELQPRLLRLLQEGTYRRLGDPVEQQVDLRVVAATNVDLPGRVDAGEFRRDLYFRLCVLEVGLPPLRERGSDVVDLVTAFVRRGLGKSAGPGDVLPEAVLSVLGSYDWPGNVRELEALVRRACLFVQMGKALTVGMLPVGLRGLVAGRMGREGGFVGDGVAPAQVAGRPGLLLVERMMAAEREVIVEALGVAAGNRTRAAELLGISRKSLYAKMGRLGVG